MATPGESAKSEPKSRIRRKALIISALGLVLAGGAYLGHLYLLSEREKERAAEAARPFAEIAQGVRPLVERCRALGPVKALPATAKILVIDLRDGTRNSATDELPQKLQGSPLDANLLVFAVVGVQEELLTNYYSRGRPGYRLHITVAAVRWPQKEPLGLWVVKDDPPIATFLKEEEIPRGDVKWRVGYLIRGLSDTWSDEKLEKALRHLLPPPSGQK